MEILWPSKSNYAWYMKKLCVRKNLHRIIIRKKINWNKPRFSGKYFFQSGSSFPAPGHFIQEAFLCEEVYKWLLFVRQVLLIIIIIWSVGSNHHPVDTFTLSKFTIFFKGEGDCNDSRWLLYPPCKPLHVRSSNWD